MHASLALSAPVFKLVFSTAVSLLMKIKVIIFNTFLTPVSRVAKNLLYYVLVGVLLLIRCPLHQHNIPSHQTTSSNIDRGLSAVFSKRSGFSAREEEVLGHHVSLLGQERRK